MRIVASQKMSLSYDVFLSHLKIETSRLTLFFVVASVAAVGCLKKDRELLCRSDDDCESGRSCELISGLCIPSIPDSAGLGLDDRVGFAIGAFDCPLLAEGVDRSCQAPTTNNTPMTKVTFAPGLASVRIETGDEWSSRCDTGGMTEMMPNPGDQRAAGIQTGCLFRKFCEMEIGPPETAERPEFFELRFQQIDSSPMDPQNRLQFYFRANELAVGDLESPEHVQGRYYERCSENSGGLSGETASTLTLQAITASGKMTITSVDNDRVTGTFAIAFAQTGTRTFGQSCDLPKDCSEGCAHLETNTPQCLSATCFPDLREPTSPSGLCSGDCADSEDCGSDLDSANFCLLQPPPPTTMMTMPGQRAPPPPRGRCIRLCDADAAEDECPEGTHCENGPPAIPNEFFGAPGPARCLRAPPPPPPPRAGDGGLPPGDGGGPPPGDAGGPPPGDAGGPPPGDGGGPPPGDGGGPPPGDGGGPPPGDGGGPPPGDGGGPPPGDGGGPPPGDGGGPPPGDGGGPPPGGGGGPPPGDGGPPPDGGMSGDAGPGSSALGQACVEGATPCPGIYFCATQPGSSMMDGFCTRTCDTGLGDTNMLCSGGYVGPGSPRCDVPLRRILSNNVVRSCGIACGATFTQDGMCPSSLTCGDVVDNTTLMPGQDGQPDYCVDQ